MGTSNQNRKVSRKRSAIHEAGHVVVGIVLGLEVTDCTIDHAEIEFWLGKKEGAETEGMTSIHLPDLPDSDHEGLLRYGCHHAAGIEAEAVVYHRRPHRESSDDENIKDLLVRMFGDGPEVQEQDLAVRKHARELIRKDIAALQRVAGNLLKYGTLDGRQLRSLVMDGDSAVR